MEWIPALVILGLAVLSVVLHTRINKAMAKRRMANRPRLGADEFARRFFPQCPEIASKTRTILAKYLPVDLSQLRPQDEPVKDLRMDELDSMATLEFMVDIESEFGISVSDEEAQGMKTFGDVVTILHKKVKKIG